MPRMRNDSRNQIIDIFENNFSIKGFSFNHLENFNHDTELNIDNSITGKQISCTS